MKSNSVPACAGAFVLISLASATTALARNWLTSEPDATPAIIADTPTPMDSAFNYGSRVGVRIYRPDGVYELRNGNFERSRSGFPDPEAETLDD
jgi:hypothetical protein